MKSRVPATVIRVGIRLSWGTVWLGEFARNRNQVFSVDSTLLIVDTVSFDVENGTICSFVLNRIPQPSHWRRRTMTCGPGLVSMTHVVAPHSGQLIATATTPVTLRGGTQQILNVLFAMESTDLRGRRLLVATGTFRLVPRSTTPGG